MNEETTITVQGFIGGVRVNWEQRHTRLNPLDPGWEEEWASLLTRLKQSWRRLTDEVLIGAMMEAGEEITLDEEPGKEFFDRLDPGTLWMLPRLYHQWLHGHNNALWTTDATIKVSNRLPSDDFFDFAILQRASVKPTLYRYPK